MEAIISKEQGIIAVDSMIYDINTKQYWGEEHLHTSTTGLQFINNGMQLLSSGYIDERLYLQDIKGHILFERIMSDKIRSMDLTHDGKKIALAYEDETEVRYLQNNELIKRYKIGGIVEFTPDDQYLLGSNRASEIKVQSLTNKKSWRWKLDDFPIAESFVPGRQQLAFAMQYNGKVGFYHYPEGKHLFDILTTYKGLSSLAFSPDGKWLAVAGNGKGELSLYKKVE